MTIEQVRAYEELYAKTWIAFERQQIKEGKVKENQRFIKIKTNAEKNSDRIKRNENYANILQILRFAKKRKQKLNFEQIALLTELPKKVASHHLNVLAQCNMIQRERHIDYAENKKISRYLYFI